MKKVTLFVVLALVLTGLLYADHKYEEVASVHDIMEVVQGPSMKELMRNPLGVHRTNDFAFSLGHPLSSQEGLDPLGDFPGIGGQLRRPTELLNASHLRRVLKSGVA